MTAFTASSTNHACFVTPHNIYLFVDGMAQTIRDLHHSRSLLQWHWRVRMLRTVVRIRHAVGSLGYRDLELCSSRVFLGSVIELGTCGGFQGGILQKLKQKIIIIQCVPIKSPV